MTLFNEIHLYNIAAENIFQWMFKTVIDEGGDGGAVLVCDNFKEVADLFEEWYNREYGGKLANYRSYGPNQVSYTWIQDNLIFTNKIMHLWPGEYTWVVQEDCPFYHYTNIEPFKDKVIKAYKE